MYTNDFVIPNFSSVFSPELKIPRHHQDGPFHSTCPRPVPGAVVFCLQCKTLILASILFTLTRGWAYLSADGLKLGFPKVSGGKREQSSSTETETWGTNGGARSHLPFPLPLFWTPWTPPIKQPIRKNKICVYFAK